MRIKNLWVGVLLLGCAALLLINHTVDGALWQDEAWSLASIDHPTFNGVVDFYKGDNHPPLFTFLLLGWHQLAGDQFFALRMLGFWSSLLTAALTYRFALEMFNRPTAIVAVFILITSQIVLSLGSVIRQYSFFMLLATLSTYLYWRYSLAFSVKVSGFRFQVSGENPPLSTRTQTKFPFPVYGERARDRGIFA